MKLPDEGTLLFFGDSITDSGRDYKTPEDKKPGVLGVGYVSFIHAQLGCRRPSPKRRVLNMGVNGNRVYDLEQRLEGDVLARKPAVVTILVGVNDTLRRFDSNIASPIVDFRDSYHRVLEQITTRVAPRPQLVLMEPFLPHPDDHSGWRADLEPRITVVRDLASEFQASLIPLDGMFAAAAARAPASHWIHDGVHPSPAGHQLIADAWLANAGCIFA
jgi:lysophospholipase L1-like esterase